MLGEAKVEGGTTDSSSEGSVTKKGGLGRVWTAGASVVLAAIATAEAVGSGRGILDRPLERCLDKAAEAVACPGVAEAPWASSGRTSGKLASKLATS